MSPPPSERDELEQLLRMLDGELQRPNDSRSATLEAYYLSAVLLLIDRWQDAESFEVASSQADDVGLFQSFARLLEAEFAEHHDATWYADQLAISATQLASVLRALTGRTTKNLISDRVMAEAERLLRHTNLTVQQIADRLGYGDPLYFSRAFRQHVGEPPSAYRNHLAGTAN